MAKKNIFAVAVTPDRGLEVAEMNPLTGAIVNYTQRDLETVTIRNVIPDMDVFKELLTDCLITIGAPKGSSLILTLPTVSMGIGNYMTSQTDASIVQLIASDLIEKELIFRDNDPLVATTGLSVSIQSKIVAYNAAVYSVIQELSRIVVELGYKVEAIDNSVASVFRALVHTGKVQIQQDTTWLLLVVDSAAARLIKLDGDRLSEYKEEQIMFDFSDATGNCDMVVSAMQSYLQQLPTKYLYVVSRTDNVSAEVLASKLTYESPIIFLEANGFASDAFIETPELPAGTDKLISLDLIGACMFDEALLHFNMFNEELGDVYWAQQPPQLKLSESTTIVLTNSFLTKFVAAVVIPILIAAGTCFYLFTNEVNTLNEDLIVKQDALKKAKADLAKNKDKVSVEIFDERDEIRIGLTRNTKIYNYFDLLGREIPSTLWLTRLELGDVTALEGRSDNIEGIYSFYRNIKDIILDSDVKLQKLSLAADKVASLEENSEDFESLEEGSLGEDLFVLNENSNDIILSSNADFYEFLISNKTAEDLQKSREKKVDDNKKSNKKRRY